MINLTRFNMSPCECNDPLCDSIDAYFSDTGEWVKFEEAMEAQTTCLQQLKAEIAALVNEFDSVAINHSQRIYDFITKLRQLSAV